MKIIFLFSFVLAGLFQSEPVADKIVSYSLGHMGKKISRGECWDLAEGALNSSGAVWTPPYDYGTKLNYKKEALQPADILQFSDVTFALPNGSMSFPHHTAIVYKASGKQVTIFQQNFNNKRYVDTLTINLDWIRKGKLEAYRPKGA